MQIDTYFEILLLFGKYSFFKIILPTFLCFRIINTDNILIKNEMFILILHWTGVMQHDRIIIEAINKTMQVK